MRLEQDVLEALRRLRRRGEHPTLEAIEREAGLGRRAVESALAAMVARGWIKADGEGVTIVDGALGGAQDPLTIRITGDPITQGSKRIGRHADTGRPIVLDDRRALRVWREVVAQTTLVARGGGRWATITGPCSVRIVIRLRRPKRPAFDYPAVQKDDIDKFARAILDGLTDGGALDDDGRVVHLDCWKVYATGEDGDAARGPGATVQIREITE